MGYIVCDFICGGTDPLGVDAKRGVDQKRAEKECESATNFGLLQAPVVQLRADVLFVTLRRTG